MCRSFEAGRVLSSVTSGAAGDLKRFLKVKLAGNIHFTERRESPKTESKRLRKEKKNGERKENGKLPKELCRRKTSH